MPVHIAISTFQTYTEIRNQPNPHTQYYYVPLRYRLSYNWPMDRGAEKGSAIQATLFDSLVPHNVFDEQNAFLAK